MASLKVGPLSKADQAGVKALVEAATLHDGVAPLSEVPLLNLGSDSPLITHVIVHADEITAGYAQIDRTGEFASAELVVHPTARRCGIGHKLLKTAEADARIPAISGGGLSAGKELRVWAHGDLAAAQAFTAAMGYEPVRELLLLSRPLVPDAEAGTATPDNAVLPPGYRHRTFRPGHDDAAWVAVNALAFANHPEQGRLSVADLQTRMAEPWFNRQDFHLITFQGNGSSGVPENVGHLQDDRHPENISEHENNAEQIAAFCWAKVPVLNDGQKGETGEIYAIGVHPQHRRRGLAAYLLQAAAHQMAAAGLKNTTLYVEGNNEAALAAYYTAGFTPLTADIQYAKQKGVIGRANFDAFYEEMSIYDDEG